MPLKIPLTSEVGCSRAQDFLNATRSTLKLDVSAMSKAAAPLTCGAAMLVPSSVNVVSPSAGAKIFCGGDNIGLHSTIASGSSAQKIAHAIG